MLALRNVKKVFNDNIIFSDVNLSLNANEVLVLIGDNGVGKTTLLELIFGNIKPDSGFVLLNNEVVGYVPQKINSGLNVADCFIGVDDWLAYRALSLVGLDELLLESDVSNLSGGQKMRLSIASVLASDPELTMLLLDEPTNNLDVNGKSWLVNFIKAFRGGIILSSHDRAFINQVATKIVEIKDGKLRQYGGNYDFYKQQRVIENETQKRKYDEYIREKKKIKHLIGVSKKRAVEGVRMKKSKDNDKMLWTFKNQNVQNSLGRLSGALESRLDRLEKVDRPEEVKIYRASLSGQISNNKLVIRFNDVRKSFDRTILNNVNFEIRGNERVQVAGLNGSGKTTLLKIANGLIMPDSGSVDYGNDIKIGYYSQEIDGLDYDKTGFENLVMNISDLKLNVISEAHKLGFSNADLQKKISQLSHGQIVKLGFVKLLLCQNQLLILDEPTNHLDIATREIIETSLNNYQGAILVASHDRYFIDSLNIDTVIKL